MPDQEERDPTHVSEWPSKVLLSEAQQVWIEMTNKAISAEDARSIVVGIANLFDVVGTDRLIHEGGVE